MYYRSLRVAFNFNSTGTKQCYLGSNTWCGYYFLMTASSFLLISSPWIVYFPFYLMNDLDLPLNILWKRLKQYCHLVCISLVMGLLRKDWIPLTGYEFSTHHKLKQYTRNTCNQTTLCFTMEGINKTRQNYLQILIPVCASNLFLLTAYVNGYPYNEWVWI